MSRHEHSSVCNTAQGIFSPLGYPPGDAMSPPTRPRTPSQSVALGELAGMKALFTQLQTPAGPQKRPPTCVDALTRTGDLMVTRLGRRFAIGRISADGKTQAFIETQSNRAAALARARALACSGQCVFIRDADRHTPEPVDSVPAFKR